MGRSLEKSGKTVDDAIKAALSELNLSSDDVHIDILNNGGKSGLFGLLSGKPARVRVSELDEDERVPQPGYTGAASCAAPGDAVIAGKTAARDLAGGDAFDGGDIDDDAGTEEGSDVTEGGAAHYAADGENADSARFGDSRRSYARGNGARGGGESNGAGGTAGADEAAKTAGAEDGEFSEEPAFDYNFEINRAMEYLGEIFKGVHVDVNMNAEPAEGGFLINIESDDSGILIGHRGETLDSIQYLLNLYMNKERNVFIRVSIDIENYKKKREAALIRLAGQMADKVVRLRRNFTLDAMNSYERRIIHSVLQNNPKVETYSVGEDPNRKVVVTLKNKGGYSSR